MRNVVAVSLQGVASTSAFPALIPRDLRAFTLCESECVFQMYGKNAGSTVRPLEYFKLISLKIPYRVAVRIGLPARDIARWCTMLLGRPTIPTQTLTLHQMHLQQVYQLRRLLI